MQSLTYTDEFTTASIGPRDGGKISINPLQKTRLTGTRPLKEELKIGDSCRGLNT